MGLFDEPYDLRKHRIVSHFFDPQFDTAVTIQCGSDDFVSLSFRYWHAFSSDHRFIDVCGASRHYSIERYFFSWPYEECFADRNVTDRNVEGFSITDDVCRCRLEPHELLDRTRCFALRLGFQPLAQKHERDEQSRCLEVEIRNFLAEKTNDRSCNPDVDSQIDDAEDIGHRRADRDETVHRKCLHAERRPHSSVESPPEDELHRSREDERDNADVGRESDDPWQPEEKVEQHHVHER